MDYKEFIKDEREYRAHPAINFSKLGWLDTHPSVYKHNISKKTDDEEDKSYFAVGGGLDALITGGETEFKKHFHILKSTRPAAKLGELSDKIAHWVSRGVPYNIAFDTAYQECGYKLTKERVQSDLEENGEYLKEKVQALKTKRVLDAAEGKNVFQMKELLMAVEPVAYFIGNPPKGCERLFQKPILFEVNGRQCKALLDILFIDHTNKIVKPVDLKTTGKSAYEFRESFITFRYYLQAAYYTEAVKQWMDHQTVSGIHDFSNYSIDNFRFIVIEKNKDYLPIIHKCTKDDLYCGKHGGKIRRRSRKGFLQLLDELKWHEENNIWNTTKELYLNNFELELNAFDSTNDYTSESEQTEIPW